MAASEERRAGERDRQKFQLANAASGGGLTKVSGGRPTAGRKHQAALHPQTPDERQMQFVFIQRVPIFDVFLKGLPGKC